MKHDPDADPQATKEMLTPASLAAAATEGMAESPSGSGRLEVRCPNCHAPTEVAVDTSLTDLTCGSCGSHFSLVDQSKATRMAPPLSQMGRFELIERLGIGGFGSVWKARDKELDRTVAIKIPRHGAMTGEEQEKFFREARAAAQLRHPNIVSVHEVGRDGDSVYIVSDFVRGVTLGDWLTGQQLTGREAAELCAKIGDALHHAHELGVVHRDLKPANIMIDMDGQPHLMDFGLARRETGEVTVTMDGQVLGTPAYMSPEQAEGKGHAADRRSDVYSLGVILFQLVTGELPFRGNARMLMHQVINDEPPSPRKLNSSVPRDLETITLKCLNKVPSKRYQHAGELSEDLRRWLTRRPITARPVGYTERTWRWLRRNPIVASLTAVVVASLLAIAGLSLSRASAIRAENARTRAALADVESARKQAEAAAERNRHELYSASMNLATQAWNTGAVPRLLMTLEKQAPRIGESDLRGFQWRHLWRNSSPFATSTILRAEVGVVQVAYSPDGALLACALSDGSVVLWQLDNNEFVRRLKTDSDRVASVGFSADSATMATLTGDGIVRLWDVATGDLVGSTVGSAENLRALVLSPVAKQFATGAADGSLKLWSLDGKPLEVSFEKFEIPVLSLAWSRDGRVIASSYQDDSVNAWDAATGKKLNAAAMSGGPDYYGGLALSPDGALVAAGAYQRVHVWNTATGEIAHTTFCHPNELVTAVAWSPDGNSLATAGGDAAITIHRAATWEQIRVLKGHADDIPSVAYSPDGQRIASSSDDGATILWDLPKLAEQDYLDLYAKSVETSVAGGVVRVSARAMALSPVGSLAVTGSADGELALWDASISTVEKRLANAHGRAAISDIAFFPDGKQFASIGADATIRTWDTASLSPVEVIRTEGPAPSRALSIDPKGRLLAYRAGPKTIQICRSESGASLRTLEGHSDEVNSLRFSPAGQRLVSVGRSVPVGGEALLWDVESGRQIASHKERRANILCAAFSPRGDVLALGLGVTEGVAEILICDASNLKVLSRLAGSSMSVQAVGFSRDGRTLLAGSSDGVIRFWSVSTYADEGAIAGDTSRPTNIDFSADGTIAAISRTDGTVEFLRAAEPSNGTSQHATTIAALPRPVEHWPLDSGSQEAILFYETLGESRKDSLGADAPLTLQAQLSLNAAYARRGVQGWSDGYQKTLARLREVLGKDHRNVIRAVFDLGQIHADLEQPVLAARYFKECLELQRRLLGANHRETIASIEALANSYKAIGRRDDQLALQVELLAAKQALLGEDHAECVLAERTLIDGFVAAAKPRLAFPHYRHHLAVLTRQFGETHENVLKLMSEFSRQLQLAGDFVEASKLLKPVVEAHPDNLEALTRLCDVYRDAGMTDDARQLVDETLKNREGRELTLDELCNISWMSLAAGNVEQSIELLTRATADVKDHRSPAWNPFAYAYAKAGRKDDSIEAWRKALKFTQEQHGDGSTQAETMRRDLLAALWEAGLNEEALAALPPREGDVWSGRWKYFDIIARASEGKHVAASEECSRLLIEWARENLRDKPEELASVLATSTEQLNERACWAPANLMGQAAVENAAKTFPKAHPQIHRANDALAAATCRELKKKDPLPTSPDMRPTIEDLFAAIGQKRSVEFRAANVGGNNNLYLNSLADWQRKDCFTVHVPSDAIKSFADIGVKNPWRELPGSLLRATGVVQESDGRLEIRVTDLAAQLKILEPSPPPTAAAAN